LDALIPQGGEFQSEVPESGLVAVEIDQIKPNPRQPRSNFEPKAISELADSIAEHGVIQPLIISQESDRDEYVLIAGERRLLAAKEAGLQTIPAVVREISEQGMVEIALIENIQRADLNPLEMAEAYRQLTEEFGLSHDVVGKRIGKSRVAVTNTLRLLNLPASVQQAITDGKISEGHARALLGLPTSQSQTAALQTILEKEINVRQTEALVRKLTGDRPRPKPAPEASPEIKALEERLRQRFGTRVSMKQGRNGGSITIHYYSDEELEALLGIILPKDDF
jgi:ParB family chromosome partitioning protein